MLGPTLKFTVISFAFFILIGNHFCAELNCDQDTCKNLNCPNIKTPPKENSCLGLGSEKEDDKGKQSCSCSSISSKCSSEDNKATVECTGKCEKPQCKPNPCASKKCMAECKKPGCEENKNGALIQQCPPPSSSDDCSTKQPPKKPLSGNTKCQDLLPKDDPGPIFTSSSSNLEPNVQCSRCSLQLTPDDAAVILTCYDCSDLKQSCGGDRKSQNSIGSTGSNSRSSTGSSCSKKEKNKCSRDKQESRLDQQEISNPRVYQAYYIEIANYTDPKRNLNLCK